MPDGRTKLAVPHANLGSPRGPHSAPFDGTRAVTATSQDVAKGAHDKRRQANCLGRVTGHYIFGQASQAPVAGPNGAS